MPEQQTRPQPHPRFDHDGKNRWLVYVNRHGAIRRERIHPCRPPNDDDGYNIPIPKTRAYDCPF